MKYRNKCIKCGSSNIVIITNDGHPDGSNGNNIMCKSTILSGVVYIKRYICCDCGYTEEWLDSEDIQIVLASKKFRR